MSSLVQDDLTRATTFFALAFGLTALGGLAIGDLRLGVEYGLALGVGFAVFAYFFVAPTALDDDGSDGDPEPGPDDEAATTDDEAATADGEAATTDGEEHGEDSDGPRDSEPDGNREPSSQHDDADPL